MALMSAGLPVTFPSSINANITNTSLNVTGTVSTVDAAKSTIGTEKIYTVTTTSTALLATDITATQAISPIKGAEIQYLTENASDRLYTRTDAQPVTNADAKTTGLQVIELQSLLDVQNFRYMGSGGTIKVVYRTW